ncbi:MAG: transcriptional regulator NrdR [Myxococcales bacterium]|jgi:transcriptional repressor NrdR
MRCPFCKKTENKVIDSRLSHEGHAIRRRRECLDCERRFTTYERVEDTLPLVVKKDGRRESFDREKIAAGLKKAVEKRPVPAEQIEQMLDAIEQKIQETGEKEVQSRLIGELVMKALQQIDDVAYVRFASVYRDFRDVQEFMNELKELLAERSKLDRAARKRVSRAS